MSRAAAAPPVSAAGIALSVILLGAAGGLIFQGVQLLRYSRISTAASELLAEEYWRRPLFPQLAPLREQAGEWRDAPGVRSGARALYFRLGQASGVPAPTLLAEAADVIRIDPVSGEAWANFATASLAASRVDLALAAWDVSSVLAPREDRDMLWRLSFLAGLWSAASEAQKQRFFFDIQLLSTRGGATRFGNVWPGILRSLPREVAREIEGGRRALPRPGW